MLFNLLSSKLKLKIKFNNIDEISVIKNKIKIKSILEDTTQECSPLNLGFSPIRKAYFAWLQPKVNELPKKITADGKSFPVNYEIYLFDIFRKV